MSRHPRKPYTAIISDHAYLALRSRVEDDCLAFTGGLSDGYGVVNGRRENLAHRLAYVTWVGPVPAGLELDHLCRNRRCIWPEHLEAVPKVVNWARGESPQAQNARKTHCVHGHPLSGENLRMVSEDSHLRRRCVTCLRRTSRVSRIRFKTSRVAGILEGKAVR